MISPNGTNTLSKQKRCGCPISRTHKRFLLRTLCFTQQYASMYRCRMEAQYVEAIEAIRKVVMVDYESHSSKPLEPSLQAPKRLLELAVGVPSLCGGVIYKQMKLLPRFLDKYQQELVRIDAGYDENDADGEEMTELLDDVIEVGAETGARLDGLGNDDGNLGQAQGASDEQSNLCTSTDELTLEDSSGRVILQGMSPNHFCTGIILGIYGTLQSNGRLQVHKYAFASMWNSYVPRTLFSTVRLPPCYVAFVCCLNVDLLPTQASEGEGADPEVALRTHMLTELLVDFIQGNVKDPEARERSRSISRLVIGGNSIAPTEELKLRSKIMLDPCDQKRLNDRTNTGAKTSAALMQELDILLSRLVSSVEVELMPGDTDPSDAFHPQQPLHPLLLPNASRYSSLRLVTNPFEFSVLTSQQTPVSEGFSRCQLDAEIQGKMPDSSVSIFVTSGENVHDVSRQTRFNSRLEVMTLMLASGCAYPTAPNTLFSYPFKDEDPFLLRRIPDCFVACDQPSFDTRLLSMKDLDRQSTSHGSLSPSNIRTFSTDDKHTEEPTYRHSAVEKEKGEHSVRLICVPSFSRTGTVVLVDVNSPELETIKIEFSVG